MKNLCNQFTTSLLLLLVLGSAIEQNVFGVVTNGKTKKIMQIVATTCKKINGDTPIEPTTLFTKDADVVYITWRSQDAREGMSYKVVWIAENVGKAAPPNTTITEKSGVLSDKAIGKVATWWSGNFSLTRPTNGWPVGLYRADLYFDGNLIKSLRFSIK